MSSSFQVSWESFKDLFGINYSEIESSVEDLPGHYKDLDPRALYTSLEDFYHLMASPYIFGTWVDLGAGIGESVLMYAMLFPDRKAIGVEGAEARFIAGEKIKRKIGINNATLIQGDLLSCEIPHGDTYFLYFSTGPVLDRMLDEIRKIDFKFLIVIESHGDLLPRISKEEWLKPVASIPLRSQRHFSEAVIFSKLHVSLTQGPHQLSYQDKFVVIRDERGDWLGDSFGLEWLSANQYQLLHPPRTINWSFVEKVLDRHELRPSWIFLVDLRRLGEVELCLETKTFLAHIRKIQLTPSFELELSSGEWVKWEEIKTINLGNTLCYDHFSQYFFLPLAH